MISPTGEKYGRIDISDYSETGKKYKILDESKITPRQPSLVEEELYRLKKEREKLLIARQAMPRTDESPIQKLQLKSEKVMGSLFDRVRFLEARISELEGNIAVRTRLHEEIIMEIERDIDDKNRLAEVISDANERRNLKLDVSVLRKEKRHENVQFWKDVMEIKIELRQLREEHETERKISMLFLEGEDE